MRREIYLSLIVISILSIGCGDSNKTVAINNIEKSINKEATTVGCGKNRDNSRDKECTQTQTRDSAEFILNVLAKENESKKESEDIGEIKRGLNSSLEIISKEEHKQSRLKDSLIALVNEVDNSKEVKKRRLENFINSIDNNRISLIKDELNSLVESGSRDLKSKDIKRELESLITDVTESTKSLVQTQKSLKRLVENAEKKDSKSIRKFTNAIIRDVKDKKIAIIEENDKYFIIKVQKGDNLSILAKRYYNDKKKYRLIYEANRDKINSKYEIFPNTTLVIPKI